MEVGCKLDDNQEILTEVPYRNLICCLICIELLQQNRISCMLYAVSLLSRVLDKPTIHAKLLKELLDA